MTKPYLDSFVLVGGTALALQIGHRTSIDLDLFTNELFSAADIYDQLEDELRVAEPFVKDKAPYLWK